MKHNLAEILRLTRTFDIKSENFVPDRAKLYFFLVKT